MEAASRAAVCIISSADALGSVASKRLCSVFAASLLAVSVAFPVPRVATAQACSFESAPSLMMVVDRFDIMSSSLWVLGGTGDIWGATKTDRYEFQPISMRRAVALNPPRESTRLVARPS